MRILQRSGRFEVFIYVLVHKDVHLSQLICGAVVIQRARVGLTPGNQISVQTPVLIPQALRTLGKPWEHCFEFSYQLRWWISPPTAPECYEDELLVEWPAHSAPGTPGSQVNQDSWSPWLQDTYKARGSLQTLRMWELSLLKVPWGIWSMSLKMTHCISELMRPCEWFQVLQIDLKNSSKQGSAFEVDEYHYFHE